MKIKCVRCGAKSKMALCPQCLPPDVTAQTIAAGSVVESLPTLSEVKGGAIVAIDETKQLISKASTWLKANSKRLSQYKNWNIAFDKTGFLALAKDTAVGVLPLIILGFVSAKILLGRIEVLDGLASGELAKAAAFWALNFALGIGITVSGTASAYFISASAGGTARLIASGLTILLTYLLIRKSRARAAEGKFTLNAQTEIVGTAAVLSFISFALTSLTARAFGGGTDIRGIPISGSISVFVDFYSLFIGPLIISTIAVLLGSYAVKKQKKISDSLNQSVAFLLGATAVVTVIVVLAALKEREFTVIPVFLAVAPTVVLGVLVGASGVPIINTASDNPVLLMTPDITHPTLSLFLYLSLLLIALLLIGTVMGFRIDPRSYTARNSTRIVLSITGIVLFLNFFLMFYAFGDASALFDLASSSETIAIFANPLYLIPASLLWGAVYVFGARYLTPIAAELAPILVSKVIPKLRISISEYYLQTPEPRDELTPLQKQTKTMQATKAKSIAKKGVLVVAAFFIITGPANDFVANKLSSPTSAVSGFFNSLTANNAGAALSHVNISEELSTDLLTDEVLAAYLHKPKVISIEVMDSSQDYANVRVAYTLNGVSATADLSLVKDSENKRYKIFPVWKISESILRAVNTKSFDGLTIKFGNVVVPKDSLTTYLFPGIVRTSSEDPIYTTSNEVILPANPYDDIRYEYGESNFNSGALAYIEELARTNISECNGLAENPRNECPIYQDVTTRVLKTVENFTVTNIQVTNSGYSFTLTFDGTLTDTNPSTGVSKNRPYNYSATCYLSSEDGYRAIYWATY
jgi:hypothetical protein